MNILNLLKKNKALPEQLEADTLIRQARMAEKREQAIKDLGEKWILHPCHKVVKLNTPRGF